MKKSDRPAGSVERDGAQSQRRLAEEKRRGKNSYLNRCGRKAERSDAAGASFMPTIGKRRG